MPNIPFRNYQKFGGKLEKNIRLEVGAGTNFRNSYIHLDKRPLPHIEIVADARHIPLEDESCEEVYAAHLLEHFSWREIPDVLKEWYRVLQQNGKLEIYVPDFNHLRQMENTTRALWFIYGEQDYEENFHKSGFTLESLSSQMTQVGFKDIKRLPCNDGWALHIEGFK